MAQQSAEFQAKVDDSHKGDDEPKQVESQKPSDENNQEPKTENKTTSLFGSMISTQNLFNNTGVTPGSLFSGSSLFGPTPTTGLFASGQANFNNTNVDLSKPGPSLFGINYNTQQNKSDGSEGEDDGEEGVKDDEEEPKQIVMKFDYHEKTEQLVKVSVEKFRKNTNDVLEKGTVALEKLKAGNHFYFIYRNAIQQILYTGSLIKGFSDVKPLGTKPENIILKALNKKEKKEKEGQQEQQEQQEEGGKNYLVDTLKVMFTTKEGAEEFKKALSQAFQ